MNAETKYYATVKVPYNWKSLVYAGGGAWKDDRRERKLFDTEEAARQDAMRHAPIGYDKKVRIREDQQ